MPGAGGEHGHHPVELAPTRVDAETATGTGGASLPGINTLAGITHLVEFVNRGTNPNDLTEATSRSTTRRDHADD